VTENLLTEWARLLLGSLARAGVQDVVVSPGSRSTPFAWAALSTPGLRCHSIVDERSAGFFALGQARVSGRPSVVLSTSGSAAANYFPAVVEAAYGFTPLVVLTADRPLELQEAGGLQCMDQVKLYGGMVRRFLDLGHPEGSLAALDGLERRIAQAVSEALAPTPGPVHLNVRARKPLEPRRATTSDGEALTRAVTERLAREPTRVFAPARAPSPEALSEVASRCARVQRGLVVCGPIAPARSGEIGALFDLARALGYPLYAEATSQARFALPNERDGLTVIGNGDSLFASPLLELSPPELVLLLGQSPTSAACSRWLGAAAVERVLVAPEGLPDPSNRTRLVVHADPLTFAAALARALPELPSAALEERRRFARAFALADEACFRAVPEAAPSELGEADAVRVAIGCLPDDGLLGIGNSLAIRDVDVFVPPRPGRVRVWSQRGLSGIDGLVSGAAGAAASARVPSLCLLGDISFLHDVGGLAAARAVETPLALVVIDNGGGRIFEHLPLEPWLRANPENARFWVTPQEHELRHAALLYGLPFAQADTAAALGAAVTEALARPGCTVIRARVKLDSARTARAAIATALATTLEAKTRTP